MPKPQRHPRPHACALALGLLTAAAGLTTGCGNNGCEEVREAYCLSSLQSRSGASLTSVYVWGMDQWGTTSTLSDTLALTAPDGTERDTIVTYEVASNAMMLSLTSPTEMEFILNPNDSITRLRLQMTSTYYGETSQHVDTLTLRYHATPYFIDMECGCTVRFELHAAETTHHFLQAVTIKNPLVSNEETTNLQIDY